MRRGRLARLAAALLVALAMAPRAHAHDVRSAYLELQEFAPGQVRVLWRAPTVGGMRLPVSLRLPTDARDLKEPVTQKSADALIERRWIDLGAQGLTNRRVEFAGLELTVTDVLVHYQTLDGRVGTSVVHPSRPWWELAAAPSWHGVAREYLVLGVEHIWGGIDHLLFVLSLLLLLNGWRPVVATVTAFTVAHSVTLAVATLGFVRVPQQPIEAAIALSIVFLAAEIVHGQQGRPGWTARWPWMVAFAFGLLHGFGFASALREVGLPHDSIPIALLFFNAGVEIGQVLFIAAVIGLLASVRWIGRRAAIPRLEWLQRFAPYCIGGIAAFWTIQRVAAF